MRWYEASSPEDLKTLGKLKTVKSMINKDIREIIGKQKIDSFIKMGSNSWKGVFDKIQYLKKIGLVVAENNGQSIGCNDKKYFLMGKLSFFIPCGMGRFQGHSGLIHVSAVQFAEYGSNKARQQDAEQQWEWFHQWMVFLF